VIKNWHGPLPKIADLRRYEKGTGFNVVEEVISHQYLFVSSSIYPQQTTQEDPSTIYVTVAKASPVVGRVPNLISLPINSDYKLILDNKVEYPVTNIESSNRGNLGCPIKSLMINNHKHDGLHFNQDIGEPVTH